MSASTVSHRRGMAMMLVLALSVVVLALGMAMVALSGQGLSAAADSKARVKSRYAAESGISVAIADAVYQAGEIFGGGVSATTREVTTAEGTGKAEVSSGANLGQEVILQKRSPMNQLRGNKIPLRIEAEGRSGSAKTRVSATVALYQVPIYQFGVFYEGPLEITPGPDMLVMGRVHTNRSAYFRGVATLSFEGPVTVADTIFQWCRSGTGFVKYQLRPDDATLYAPGLTGSLTPMNPSTQPPAVNGVRNARYGETRLVLPIGVGTPHSILGVRDGSDPPALRRQKFDWIVASRSSADARFVWAGSSTSIPSWIRGPYVFFDRREQNWVKVWDFDVQILSASSNRDSIFYLDDTTTSYWHVSGGGSKRVLNAFRIVNARTLPRNMTIAVGKPVYIMGDFNKQSASGDTSAYVNAQVASDAFTVLSSQWPSWQASAITGASSGALPANRSSREQSFANADWLSCANCGTAPTSGSVTGNPVAADVRINAAVITGNKQSRNTCLGAYTAETAFEGCYEGGWHNTLRFLEDFGSARRVVFKGSFVCLWEANTPGLYNPATGRVWGTSYYNPPQRLWGYDRRFNNLANMPPGSPFLATAIVTNWLERN